MYFGLEANSIDLKVVYAVQNNQSIFYANPTI